MLHPPPPGALGSTLWRCLPAGKSLSSGCTFLPRGLLAWVLCLIPPFQCYGSLIPLRFFSPLRSALGEVADHSGQPAPPHPAKFLSLLLTEHGCPDLVTPSAVHLKGSHHSGNRIPTEGGPCSHLIPLSPHRPPHPSLPEQLEDFRAALWPTLPENSRAPGQVTCSSRGLPQPCASPRPRYTNLLPWVSAMPPRCSPEPDAKWPVNVWVTSAWSTR